MSFVSYAQNYEDVMLWRALKDIENGFYIDVGANDPVIESVTKLFYDNGWSGINIEPIKSHYKELLDQRPRDINLNCAVSNLSGSISLWECDIRGWATADAEVVAMHEASGYKGVWYNVPSCTLKEICDKYCKSQIHFMKIDVEGFEKPVLNGMDLKIYRPWILIVEATKPSSTKENHQKWEAMVTSAKYMFAYHDGLNRFYVAEEHIDLIKKLQYPPNVFDGFIRHEQFTSELRAQQSEAKAQLAEAKAQEAEAKAQVAEAKGQQVEHALNLIHSSRSWRVTAPLRWFCLQLRLLHGHGLRARLKAFTRKLLKSISQQATSWLDKRPNLRKRCIALAQKIGIDGRLRSFYHKITQRGYPQTYWSTYNYGPGNPSLTQLSPRARRIFYDLKNAIERNKEQKG